MTFTKFSQVMMMLIPFFIVKNVCQYSCSSLSNIFVCDKDIFYRFIVWQRIYEYKMKIPTCTFPTDTQSLFFKMEDVQEVSLTLGHDEPVSVGCPLYNEASAFGDRLVVSSNVIAQRLD